MRVSAFGCVRMLLKQNRLHSCVQTTSFDDDGIEEQRATPPFFIHSFTCRVDVAPTAEGFRKRFGFLKRRITHSSFGGSN